MVIEKFHASYFPEFFQERPLEEDICDQKFTQLIVVNTQTKNYFERPFEGYEIDFIKELKYLCQRTNNFSSKLEENIYFCSLISGKQRPIKKFETFFWIGKPIQHSQKNKILRYIFDFLDESISEKDEV